VVDRVLEKIVLDGGTSERFLDVEMANECSFGQFSSLLRRFLLLSRHLRSVYSNQADKRVTILKDPKTRGWLARIIFHDVGQVAMA